MDFIANCYMYINLFALQHIADRPGVVSCVKVKLICVPFDKILSSWLGVQKET